MGSSILLKSAERLLLGAQCLFEGLTYEALMRHATSFRDPKDSGSPVDRLRPLVTGGFVTGGFRKGRIWVAKVRHLVGGAPISGCAN